VIAIPLSKLLSLAVPSRRVRDLLLFAVLCLYSAVAGFPPSLLRALALLAAAIGYRQLSIHGDLLSALLAGSLTLAAIDSSVVFDAGFQLSCFAVCAIALIGMPLSRAVERFLPDGLPGTLAKALLFPALITCSVQFFTLPLVIILFKRSSLLSPLVNVLVSLPFTILLYAGVLYTFIPLGPMRVVLAPLMNAVCRLLDACPSSFARRPHAAVYRGDFNMYLYAAGAAFVAWGLRKSCERRRRWLVAGAVCIVFSFAASSTVWRGDEPAQRSEQGITRGDPAVARTGCIYVPAGNGIICIGKKFGAHESYAVTKELWARGVREIGCCVVTPSRLRKNHGLFYLVRRITVRQLIVSPYLFRSENEFRDVAMPSGTAVRVVSAGDRVACGNVQIDILGPPYPPPKGATVRGPESLLRCRLHGEAAAEDSLGRPAASADLLNPDAAGGG
jgi:ComEC/Rec2-related protein